MHAASVAVCLWPAEAKSVGATDVEMVATSVDGLKAQALLPISDC